MRKRPTKKMIEAGLKALESELCEDYLMESAKAHAVQKVWMAMAQVQKNAEHPFAKIGVFHRCEAVHDEGR